MAGSDNPQIALSVLANAEDFFIQNLGEIPGQSDQTLFKMRDSTRCPNPEDMFRIFKDASNIWNRRRVRHVVAFPNLAVKASEPAWGSEPHFPVRGLKRGEDRIGMKCVVNAIVLKVPVAKNADPPSDCSCPHTSIAGAGYRIHAVLCKP